MTDVLTQTNRIILSTEWLERRNSNITTQFPDGINKFLYMRKEIMYFMVSERFVLKNTHGIT